MCSVVYPPFLNGQDRKDMQAVHMHNNCKNIPAEIQTTWTQHKTVGLHKQLPSGPSGLDQQAAFVIVCHEYLVSCCIYLLLLHTHLLHFFLTEHLCVLLPSKGCNPTTSNSSPAPSCHPPMAISVFTL